jgi:hypothetical protein
MNVFPITATELQYMRTTCADCGQPVAYADTKLVDEPVRREGPTFPGMVTHVSRRICASN